MLSGVPCLGKGFLAHQRLSLVVGNLIVVMDWCIIDAAAVSRVSDDEH